MIINNKLGITLSGGGFRGIAHLGVLQYLYELQLLPDMISGASAGALLGAFIANGYTPEEILHLAKAEKLFSYTDISVRNGGIFNSNVFDKIIQKFIPHNSFEGLKIPLFVSVTDLTNAVPLVFNQGNLSFAIKASCAFPLVFQPVHYDGGIYLCDGGVLNNFPVEQVRALCNQVIGINVNPINQMQGSIGYKEVFSRIIRIVTSMITEDAKNMCDVYLQVDEINKFSTFDSRDIDEMYQLGYQHARNFEQELKALKGHTDKGVKMGIGK